MPRQGCPCMLTPVRRTNNRCCLLKVFRHITKNNLFFSKIHHQSWIFGCLCGLFGNSVAMILWFKRLNSELFNLFSHFSLLMETTWLCVQGDSCCCCRHLDGSCRRLTVLQTEVIRGVLLVWHTYLSWIHFVCTLCWLRTGGVSWPHLATRTVWPPHHHHDLFSCSRLSCDSPALITLPCVYERETKRRVSQRLEGRKHHLAVIIPLMMSPDIVYDVEILVCFLGEKSVFINKNHR